MLRDLLLSKNHDASVMAFCMDKTTPLTLSPDLRSYHIHYGDWLLYSSDSVVPPAIHRVVRVVRVVRLHLLLYFLIHKAKVKRNA